MLFTAAKVTHLNVLPQGQAERWSRTLSMVATQDSLGFGGCTNIGECSAVCPKEISMSTIARLNRDLIRASSRGRTRRSGPPGANRHRRTPR
jgi:succinate dehydrogenase / fumarate reductase iron-sulfur subunit